MDVRQSYREAAVQGASPVRLVILLYEQVMEDLRRAITAQERADIEGRSRAINHAVLILGHLQASLDKDLGGAVALNLERFYEQVRRGLVEAQCQQSVPALEKQISLIMQIYEAWHEVEKSGETLALKPASIQQPEPSLENHESLQWKA